MKKFIKISCFKNKKILCTSLLSISVLFLSGCSNSNQNDQRQTCFDKYQNLFKNVNERNDPLNYDKTNPELYKCLNKVGDPLNLGI